MREPEIVHKSNIIHTVVDDPIPLYEMPEREALTFLRDKLATWQYKMMELYGCSTRKAELAGYQTSYEKWYAHLTKRMKYVDRYDSEIEKKADYRPKDIVRPENAFRAISNVKNISMENIKMILDAERIVREREKTDFQRLF